MRRNIWKNIVYALAATPMAYAAGLIIIILADGLDDAIIKIQDEGYWWVLLIGTYIISLIYFIYEQRVKANLKRKRMARVLEFYWLEKKIKKGEPEPTPLEVELLREMFIERIKIWAWSDQKLWDECFPNERYPEFIFNIVDNLMIFYEDQKKRDGIEY